MRRLTRKVSDATSWLWVEGWSTVLHRVPRWWAALREAHSQARGDGYVSDEWRAERRRRAEGE